MAVDIFRELEKKAKEICPHIVFPEGDDDRVISAAAELHDAGIAKPILLGDEEKIRVAAEDTGAGLGGILIISHEDDSERLESFASEYASMRRNIKDTVALRLMKKKMFFAAMMVRKGQAAGMVAGAASPTTTVLQAAGLVIGYREGVPCPSSVMLMNLPEISGREGKIMAFADPAVTVDPTAEELAAIAVQSGMNFRLFTGIEPVVALLSFSSKGSASHPRVEKIVRATEIAKGLGADFPIDGELQADAALVPRVAEKKVRESEVAGRANVLVFPDLDAANIAYKLTQYLAGAEAIGPVLQGFNKPVNDLSRGATADDIFRVTTLTALQVTSV